MLFVIAKEMFVREFFESSSNSLSLSLQYRFLEPDCRNCLRGGFDLFRVR